MRVSVIGGSGFIGRHVVGHLISTGAEVVTVDRTARGSPVSGESRVTADLSLPGAAETAAEACGAVDAVVWLAASIRQRTCVDETAVEDVAVMAQAPLRFLEALARRPASFVNFSSIQVYGRPIRLPVDETHPTEPFIAYGVAKLCAETHLAIACRAAGIPLANFRVAFVYGPGQHPGNVIPRFFERLRRGEAPVVLGDGSGVRDDIYVGDVARAVGMAIQARADGCFNIAGGTPRRLLEVAEAACAAAGGTLRPRLEPGGTGWIDRWYAVDRARDAFGFEATTPLHDGLARMWAAGHGST